MADVTGNTDFVFKDWLNLLQSYHDDMEKDLETVRKHKKEIQEIRQELYNRLDSGYFLRDDKRIIISAPEIIIGNVDKSGQLQDSRSNVVIRSNEIVLHGVGEAGYIRNEATNIVQRAVDRGCDGLEEVVHGNASVMTQARNILLDSNNSEDVYIRDIDKKMGKGITIHTDSELTIDASVSHTEWTKDIDDRINTFDEPMGQLKDTLNSTLTSIKNTIEQMEDTLKEDGDLLENDVVASTSIGALDTLQLRFSSESKSFYEAVDVFLGALSQYTELFRKKNALKDRKKSETLEAFKKASTGAKISINAEKIELTNRDGDCLVRENDDTYLQMTSKNIFIGSVNDKEENHEKGKIALRGDSILVETNDRKKNGDNFDMSTTGKVEINSKEILVSSLDYEQKKDQERTEKNLTEEGNIRIRAKKINVDGTDLEGKAAGELTMNSGKISVVSAEVDKESLEIKEIHKGGTLELATETVTIGKDAAEKILSEKIEAKTNTELKLIQGDKATLTVSGNKLTVEDDGTNFSKGELTVDVESKFNKKMTATTIEANDVTGKEVTVNNCLKAPSLTAQG